MNHPYIKPVFVTYLVVMSVIALFGNNKVEVHAEEMPIERKIVDKVKVYPMEMNLADFEEIKKDVLQKDIKYIAHPEEFENDLALSEVVVTDINYASEEAQEVEVQVIRYTDSKNEKQVVDSVEGKAVIQFADTTAPVITLTDTEIELEEGSDFDANDYVKSVEDNSFDSVKLDIDHDVDTDEPGDYDVVYTATDKAGNQSSETLLVTVLEAEEEEEEVVVEETKAVEANPYKAEASTTHSGPVSGSAVASAAIAQVGIAQDCTLLVTNALKAVGIYHHSDPAGYMSLGTIVSAAEAQPGDLIYYADGGMGFAHIAVYIGGGQAVHGGWSGNQTVITTAYVGSGPVFIRL